MSILTKKPFKVTRFETDLLDKGYSIYKNGKATKNFKLKSWSYKFSRLNWLLT